MTTHHTRHTSPSPPTSTWAQRFVLLTAPLVLASCAAAPAPTTAASPAAASAPAAKEASKTASKTADDAPVAVGDAPADAPEPPPAPEAAPTAPPEPPKAAPGPPPTLDFIDWVASHCHTDILPPTRYARGWMKWVEGDTSFLPSHAPAPVERLPRLPKAGTKAAAERAQALRDAWLDEPRSRLVDCRFKVPKRQCPDCKRRFDPKPSHYTALLPKALFEDPSRVRSMLLLIPGGNGGRVRYFLTPVPGKGMRDAMSGGLETKRHVDDWVAAHPEAMAPIVVALEHNGWGTPNGPMEYITHDVPTHIAQTFMPQVPYKQVAIGTEGISSGSMLMLRALRARPTAFHTVGLTCMFCSSENGIHPVSEANDSQERRDWLAQLKARADQGKLHVRFSVGNGDPGWECNKSHRDLMASAGLFDTAAPVHRNCKEGAAEGVEGCDVHWDGFHLYRDVGHTYAMLIPAWIPQLSWQLNKLSDVAGVLASDDAP